MVEVTRSAASRQTLQAQFLLHPAHRPGNRMVLRQILQQGIQLDVRRLELHLPGWKARLAETAARARTWLTGAAIAGRA